MQLKNQKLFPIFYFCRELQTSQTNPAVLQIPRGRIRLTPHSLTDSCEYFIGLHDIIRNKFLDIVNKWFKVVPSSPDFYFYCPDSVPMENVNQHALYLSHLNAQVNFSCQRFSIFCIACQLLKNLWANFNKT